MATYENVDGLAVARELIPARIRKAIYAGASLIGYLLAAVVAGMASAVAMGVIDSIPSGLSIALAVLGALTGPLGQLAAANVPTVPDPTLPEGP